MHPTTQGPQVLGVYFPFKSAMRSSFASGHGLDYLRKLSIPLEKPESSGWGATAGRKSFLSIAKLVGLKPGRASVAFRHQLHEIVQTREHFFFIVVLERGLAPIFQPSIS